MAAHEGFIQFSYHKTFKSYILYTVTFTSANESGGKKKRQNYRCQRTGRIINDILLLTEATLLRLMQALLCCGGEGEGRK
jgi:hypothetical protein